MNVHPFAEIFPLMDGKPLDDLVADIKANGLREPIVVDGEGRIVDGRNRMIACERAGVAPTFRTWDGAGDLVALIVSLNLHRRQLTIKQRALVAGRIATLDRAQNLKKGNESPERSRDTTGIASRADAAALLNVSIASVGRARAIMTHGDPELVEQVAHGKIGLAEGWRRVQNQRGGVDKSKAAVAARLKRIAALAADGAHSSLIASRLDITESAVRKLMRVHGIDCPANHALGRAHKPNAARIMEHIILSADTLTDGSQFVDFDAIPIEHVRAWHGALVVAQSKLAKLLRILARRIPGASKGSDTTRERIDHVTRH